MAKHEPNTNVFLSTIVFVIFPGRELSNQGRGFPFGANPENPGEQKTIQIPKYFGPFLIRWLDLLAARRSSSKKASRGSPRIQIWSHEGPNHAQNHVLASPAPQKPLGHEPVGRRQTLLGRSVPVFGSSQTKNGAIWGQA